MNISRYLIGGICFYFSEPGVGLYMPGSDLIISILPFYHASGKVFGMGAAIYNGATLVIYNKYDYHTFLNAIVHYKVTTLFININKMSSIA